MTNGLDPSLALEDDEVASKYSNGTNSFIVIILNTFDKLSTGSVVENLFSSSLQNLFPGLVKTGVKKIDYYCVKKYPGWWNDLDTSLTPGMTSLPFNTSMLHTAPKSF